MYCIGFEIYSWLVFWWSDTHWVSWEERPSNEELLPPDWHLQHLLIDDLGRRSYTCTGGSVWAGCGEQASEHPSSMLLASSACVPALTSLSDGPKPVSQVSTLSFWSCFCSWCLSQQQKTNKDIRIWESSNSDYLSVFQPWGGQARMCEQRETARC